MTPGDQRLDRRVAQDLGCGRAEAQRLVLAGAVQVEGEVEQRPALRVPPEARIDVERPPEADPGLKGDPSVEVVVVHEDPAFFVVDKPAGLVVHPGAGPIEATLVHGLLARDPAIADVGPDPHRPGIVHRLDRGTSGLLVVARTEEAHAALTGMIARREVERRYDTLVAGTVPEATGRIEAPIGRSPQRPTLMAVVPDGRPAATDYSVVERFSLPESTSRLTCRLETGRTHQIRVHLAAIEHPVIGDRAYGDRSSLPLDHPFLHADRLAFAHPLTGETCEFESPLPAELVAILASLS